jgi:hypothetical protein
VKAPCGGSIATNDSVKDGQDLVSVLRQLSPVREQRLDDRGTSLRCFGHIRLSSQEISEEDRGDMRERGRSPRLQLWEEWMSSLRAEESAKSEREERKERARTSGRHEELGVHLQISHLSIDFALDERHEFVL